MAIHIHNVSLNCVIIMILRRKIAGIQKVKVKSRTDWSDIYFFLSEIIFFRKKKKSVLLCRYCVNSGKEIQSVKCEMEGF